MALISRIIAAVTILLTPLCGQWVIEDSGTTASLRGIASVDGRVAWASGSEGTVLRTMDGGKVWKPCLVPPGADKLDFRAVQAVDQSTALVMASGPGTMSRVYKTSNGCKSWRLVFTNPDAPNGFFDGLTMLPGSGRDRGRVAELVGDPVRGSFALFRTNDYGESWTRYSQLPYVPKAKVGESLFAASNSAFIELRDSVLFVTGGLVSRSRTLEERVEHDPEIRVGYVGGDLPMQHGESAGAFSVAVRLASDAAGDRGPAKSIVRGVHAGDVLVAVGGDYRNPDARQGTCAVSNDGSLTWTACEEAPGGYRSAVAFDSVAHSWIAVGPNGTDVSGDDGRHWHPSKPRGGEAADADRNWNALSLPFAVGSHGRIGRLRH